MKRVFLLMVAVALFCFTAAAQTSDTSTKSHKKSSNSAASTSDTSGGSAHSAKKGGAAKGNTVTGCVGGSAGSYTLTNGRHKNGVGVSGSDDLAPHVGHTVKLTGSWSDDKKTFNETKVDMVSETCTMGAKKGAAKGAASETTTTASSSTTTKKSSKKGAASTPPQQ